MNLFVELKAQHEAEAHTYFKIVRVPNLLHVRIDSPLQTHLTKLETGLFSASLDRLS